MNLKLHILLIVSVLSIAGCSSKDKNSLLAPNGLRPCCAFGDNLKAQFLGIPVPFISISNMIDSRHLGSHIYNDGKQFALTKLLGFSEEKNGIAYTEHGGFIDIAHVRDTADYTFYLYKQLPKYLGTGETLTLSKELRSREFYFPKTSHKPSDKIQIELAGLMAFRIAQWHEIAQWYGYESEPGFPEEVSAFSPEDLYSNMLGSILAMYILENYPNINQEDFSKLMTRKIKKTVKILGIVKKEEAEQKIESLNGIWWDSTKRVPDKWLILKREYHLSLKLTPNIVEKGEVLKLNDTFGKHQKASQWVQFKAVAVGKDKNFKRLPATVYKRVFTPADFQNLADFARNYDAKCLANYPEIAKQCR